MKSWVCSLCGYIHECSTSPDTCPICEAKNDLFIEKINFDPMQEDQVIGLARGACQEVQSLLQESFLSECRAIGIYIAMSRQAERDGYPEIADTFRRLAMEEGDHAARFAELIGEDITSDTKSNLLLSENSELQSTSSKKKLNCMTKTLGYQKIYETVQDICKDESRHYHMLHGILERYFADTNKA